MSQHKEIAILLEQLSITLNQLGLWSDMPPKPEALLSTQPFAIDTLRFDQWLQFIFLPKMEMLIESGQPLPNKIALLPMAEQVYLAQTQEYSALLDVLANIDITLSQ